MEREIDKTFSQHWSIYRVATHELGGIHLVAEFQTKYSLKQLNDMLEIIEVHDALKQQAIEKARAEANQKNK